MSTNINVSILPKFHEKNGSSITDGGHLLHRLQVEHHNVCNTSKIRWKSRSVETSTFSNTTNMGLNQWIAFCPCSEWNHTLDPQNQECHQNPSSQW